MSVVVSPKSWMCPPGWTGVVALNGAILATVPSADLVEPVQGALIRHLARASIDLALLPPQLPVLDLLGPATLAYLEAEDFVAAHTDAEVESLPVGHHDVRELVASVDKVESLPVGHHDVRELVASVDKQDADECTLEEITSEAFVIREGRKVVAAAGYQQWLSMAAHVSVLTAREHRGRGLARRVASAAVADALASGLLPQWRARPEPSRRVARALGFREFGSQISIHLRC
ncbi:GNAT family N-acetyltransferase [Nonomuraea sp. B10E15]|uniref:GNAT family N-acetyltransferase n=1 Tax=Nonomuraea sp. B10E15 TaxID=3153560 RepID=UPI00325CE6C3